MLGLSHLLIQFMTAFGLKGAPERKMTHLDDGSLAFSLGLTIRRLTVHCPEVSSLYSGNMALCMKVGQKSELSHQKCI